MLTFSGFMLLVVNFAIMIYYDLDFYASSRDHPEFPPVPSWVWLMCAINNFLSHTLGKTVHVLSLRVVASIYTKIHLLKPRSQRAFNLVATLPRLKKFTITDRLQSSQQGFTEVAARSATSPLIKSVAASLSSMHNI